MTPELRPFSGLKVLDLSWVVAGPAVGRVLADYGAEVIRVESGTRLETARLVGPFHGGSFAPEASVCYGDVNAGKLGMTLNLKLEAARDVVRDLVRRSDVVIESFSPGVMERWQLDYEHLRELNPALIMLSTSLMGQTGRYSRFAGYGNIGGAMSGFQSLVGWPDRPPLGPYGPYSDYVAPRFSLVALLAALDHRLETGEGCYLDVSQAEATVQFLAPQLADYFASGQVAERLGNRDQAMAPHGVYACAGEDSWVAIAVRSEAEWHRLAGLIGRPELAGDSRFATVADRLARAEELDAIVGAWTAEQVAGDVESLLQGHGIPAHITISSTNALADPQFAHRGHFVELPHPIHGTTVVHSSRYRLSETPAITARAAPTLGEHTEYVLREILGYDDERLRTLEGAGSTA